MTLVSGRIVSFSLEDMTEVTAACCAGNFYPGHTVRAVFVSRYRARYSVKKGWPAATAVKLGRALVQRGVATRTRVDTLIFEVLVLASTCRLSPLLTEDTELLWREDGTPFRV